jgi:phage pi2 protein 07
MVGNNEKEEEAEQNYDDQLESDVHENLKLRNSETPKPPVNIVRIQGWVFIPNKNFFGWK